MRLIHLYLYLLLAFLLAGCTAGYKAPREGQILPDYDPKLMGHKIHDEWRTKDGTEIILAENTFMSASDEYILRVWREPDSELVELKAKEIAQARLYKLDGFYVYEGVGRHCEDGQWIVEVVHIRENRVHQNVVELGHDRRKLITRNDEGERLVLAVMAEDLDDSEFWSIEQRRVRELSPNRMDWEHLEYFQVQAAKAFQKADKGKYEQQTHQDVEMQRVDGVVSDEPVKEPEEEGRVIIELED